MKPSKILSVLGRGGLSVVLAASMSAFGVVAAYGADETSATEAYWSTPSSIVTPSSSLLKTYGVRAGSAGGDFMGVTNTNFDFNKGTNSTGVTGYDSISAMGADYLTTVYGSGLAIWASSVNENANPYYANLYYTIAKGAYSSSSAVKLRAATTWMANPETSSWGDSDNTATTNVDGEETISGLEYEPEIIFGANKFTTWNLESDGSNSGTNIYAAESADDSYNPTYVTNDATNLWTQIYTMGQLATTADELTASTGEITRYNDSDATASAIAYEKATRGQLLYIASLIDSGELESKTVAYLYAIDADGTGYFFVPTAEGLVENTTASTGTGTEGATTNTSTTANQSYAANNSTINMGYMATLPFVSTTFDSGDELDGGIVMKVEDIYSENPVCTVGSSSSSTVMADIDVIIYNSTTNTSLNGTSGGKNSSGVNNDYNGDALSVSEIQSWGATYGLSSDATIIAGDDYGTSTNQGTADATYTTEDGTCPVLYCQRNYTADKDTRAAWGFAAVYPEAYDGNNDATYGYWVDEIYHVNTSDVASVVKYMTNQSDTVTYDESVAAMVDAAAEAGYEWWTTTGINDSDWSGYAYYNGASRASYYYGTQEEEEEIVEGGAEAAEEATDTIGIFAPSSLWTAANTADADDTTDSGTTEDGTTDSGTTDSGTTDSGTTEDGTTDSGTTEDGTTDSGSSDVESGTTEDGTTDSGSSEVTKLANTMTVKASTKTVKASKLKKAKKTVKAITVKKAKGKVTYKKVSGSKKLTVNKKTGKITVKKGTKKNTYKIKVKVKAAGNANYEATSKTVTVKIKVK